MNDNGGRSIWNGWYTSLEDENPNDGGFWLDPWWGLFAGEPALFLELGCGGGFDARALLSRGQQLVAADFSIEALRLARRISPGSEFVCLDMRDNFPFPKASFDAVVAHLSLHYFSWERTCQIFRRIYSVLRQDGYFFARVNAKGDRQHHASIRQNCPKIETDYYLVNGVRRRYFTGASLRFLLVAPWKLISLEEKTISRHQRPKLVWEFACRKEGV